MLTPLSQFVSRAYRRPFAFFGTFFFVSCLSYGVVVLATTPDQWLPLWEQHRLLSLGILAGVLQLIGYVAYLTNGDIDPEPVTWFMFAYGTGILVVLEWDANATLAELILPTVCAVLAIVVSYRCWRTARALDPHHWWPRDWWPDDTWDRVSFVSDILITIGYIGAWGLATFAVLTATQMAWAVFAFLFLSNLSTFPQFYPILHSTYQHPEREHWFPWTIWAVAYGILGWVTWETHGAFWHALMFYPASNAVLHAAVGALAIRPQRSHAGTSVLH